MAILEGVPTGDTHIVVVVGESHRLTGSQIGSGVILRGDGDRLVVAVRRYEGQRLVVVVTHRVSSRQTIRIGLREIVILIAGVTEDGIILSPVDGILKGERLGLSPNGLDSHRYRTTGGRESFQGERVGILGGGQHEVFPCVGQQPAVTAGSHCGHIHSGSELPKNNLGIVFSI